MLHFDMIHIPPPPHLPQPSRRRSEYDDNHDGLIGYPEFLTFSEGEGYIDDRNWHAINVSQCRLMPVNLRHQPRRSLGFVLSNPLTRLSTPP